MPERAITGASFRAALLRSGLNPHHVDEYLTALCQRGAATGALNWYRAVPLSSPRVLRAVSVPTLYVYGTGDARLGRKAADLTGRYVTGPYRYEMLEGVGHWLPAEAPDAVSALLLAHLAEHG